MLHNCEHHRPRMHGAPDARVLFQPGSVGMRRAREFPDWLESVHAEDRALGLDRLMRRALKEPDT